MLRKIKRIFKKKTYNYTKKFKSYELAEKFLKTKKTYFDKRFVNKFYSPGKVESLERFYASSVISALWKKKILNILDIGGGNNPISSYIEKSTGKSNYCYVLETKRFAEIIQKKVPVKYKKKVRYIYNLNQIKKKIDMVCFISSIQYFKNYKKIILELKKYKPEYFIITRTFFQKKNSNFSVNFQDVCKIFSNLLFFVEIFMEFCRNCGKSYIVDDFQKSAKNQKFAKSNEHPVNFANFDTKLW